MADLNDLHNVSQQGNGRTKNLNPVSTHHIALPCSEHFIKIKGTHTLKSFTTYLVQLMSPADFSSVKWGHCRQWPQRSFCFVRDPTVNNAQWSKSDWWESKEWQYLAKYLGALKQSTEVSVLKPLSPWAKFYLDHFPRDGYGGEGHRNYLTWGLMKIMTVFSR